MPFCNDTKASHGDNPQVMTTLYVENLWMYPVRI